MGKGNQKENTDTQKAIKRGKKNKLGKADPQEEDLAKDYLRDQDHIETQNNELRENQLKLEETLDNYADLYDFAPVGYLTLNEKGIIQEINFTAVEILGFNKQKLQGIPFSSFVHPQCNPDFFNFLRRLKKDKKRVSTELILNTKKGQVDAQLLSQPILNYNTGATEFRTVLTDITERKELERQVKSKQEQLSAIFNQVIVGIIQIDLDGNFRMVNKKFCEITGRSEEELLKMNLTDITYHEDIAKKKEMLKSLSPRNPFFTYQKRYVRPDGTIIWVHNNVTLISTAMDKNYAVVVVEDITEQKKSELRLQESEVRFKQLAENIDSVFYIAEPKNKRVVYLSPSFERIWGIKPEEVYNDSSKWLEKVHADDRKKVFNFIKRDDSSTELNQEFRLIADDGAVRWMNSKSFPVMDESGQVYRIVGITEDITERKASEEKIRTSLKEKEVLLKEIHHRVKNNLQIISSLLSLQSNNIKDEKDLEIFVDSQNRVKSMALIHEKLYQRNDLTGINFKEYVLDLIKILKSTYFSKARNISFAVDIENILLNIDISIGMGLIINELVSNSFKHAFPGSTKGTIEIKVSINPDNTIHLRVSDNGVGFPDGIDFKNTESLGLQLVNTLTEQHSGTIELTRNSGTGFDITFPPQKERHAA